MRGNNVFFGGDLVWYHRMDLHIETVWLVGWLLCERASGKNERKSRLLEYLEGNIGVKEEKARRR